jgi:hypothetical protein
MFLCYFIAIEMVKKLHQTRTLFLFCDKIQNNQPILIKKLSYDVKH